MAGTIAAIILALCGIEIENIVEDHSLSFNAYRELGDDNAMVGQWDLDHDVFLGASRQVIRNKLQDIEEQFKSVEELATGLGLGQKSRKHFAMHK